MGDFARALQDYLAEPDQITAAMRNYATQIVLPAIDKSTENIELPPMPANLFKARVHQGNNGQFYILIFDGITKTLTGSLSLGEGGAVDTLEQLLAKIFGNAAYAHVIAGSLISSALIFVLLHEYGHIAGGHFNFLQQSSPAKCAGFEFDEITDAFSFDGFSPGGMETGKLIELEADLIAFNLLLDVSYPLFLADENIEVLMQGREFENWRDELYPPMAELVFYGAALALALLAVHRSPEEAGGDHPLPLTRLMNLGMLLFRRMTAGAWSSENGLVHRLTVDRSAREQITSFFAPALVNAIELCEECCLAAGLDLRRLLDLQDQGAGPMQLVSADFTGLLKDDGRTLVTKEARQLRSLHQQQAGFSALMQPFRARNWWS